MVTVEAAIQGRDAQVFRKPKVFGITGAAFRGAILGCLGARAAFRGAAQVFAGGLLQVLTLPQRSHNLLAHIFRFHF